MTAASIKPAFLDRTSTAAHINVGINTLERLVQRGEFPRSRQITPNRVGWLLREIDEWAESRPVSSILPVANCGVGRAGAG